MLDAASTRLFTLFFWLCEACGGSTTVLLVARPSSRAWMIRALAVALGISTVRMVAPVLDIVLTQGGIGPRLIFGLSLWTGWAITIGAAELWIASTRFRAPSLAVSVSPNSTA